MGAGISQIDRDQGVSLRVLSHWRHRVVNDHQAPLTSPSKGHGGREFHLEARILHVRIDNLFLGKLVLATECLDESFGIQGVAGLKHQIGDQAIDGEAHERPVLQGAAPLAQEPLEAQDCQGE